ncbi:MAG: DUF2865 domain-containing protein [Deltaproteobacteria bacterium]|nr:DUF2865 domain-containing protein [Deltaproteobacteria bacterium]
MPVMTGSIYKFAGVAALIVSACAAAFAQQPQNPTCQRLEAQLTSLDRGNSDPTRAEQIRRSEEAINRQQFEVDRLVAQGRRMGCESSGFFSIFNNPPPQCGALNRQIGQQRSALERMQNEFERLNGGTTERAAQRQSLLIALGNNGCGAQYRSAALGGQQGGFFDRLFGGNGGIFSAPSGPMGGTFRTICVRTCDGYYYPISFATSPDRFRDDEQTCQRMCPAAEVSLYTYHNPGEEVTQAVSLNGRLYTELPTAFSYRKAINQACSCRRPGESWAQALKVNGTDDTVAPGDVVVTEQNAKRLSQPRIGADGKPIRVEPRSKAPAGANPAPLADAPGEIDPAKRTVRTVGPTFLPAR